MQQLLQRRAMSVFLGFFFAERAGEREREREGNSRDSERATRAANESHIYIFESQERDRKKNVRFDNGSR